uniref:Uncharacterized protein n=1 Tax=Globodera rostochiensis TaxID=31243 RepID=A0A914IAI1_GLORO
MVGLAYTFPFHTHTHTLFLPCPLPGLPPPRVALIFVIIQFDFSLSVCACMHTLIHFPPQLSHQIFFFFFGLKVSLFSLLRPPSKFCHFRSLQLLLLLLLIDIVRFSHRPPKRHSFVNGHWKVNEKERGAYESFLEGAKPKREWRN